MAATFRAAFPTATPRPTTLSFTPTSLESTILSHLRAPATPTTAAILGPAGVGKSTILHALPPHLREDYPDGIHVLTLGTHATPASLLRILRTVLHAAGASANPADVDEALQLASAWFADRACLFLVDDVWTTGLPLGTLTRLCRLAQGKTSVLLTTREHAVASRAPRDRIFRLAPREPLGEDARGILLCHAGIADRTFPDDSVNPVLHVCAGLPVSLAAAGKAVGTLHTDDTHEDPFIRYVSALPPAQPPSHALFMTFAASLSLLDRLDTLSFAAPYSFAAMFRRLSIFQKQTLVPCHALRHVWDLCLAQAVTVAQKLEQVGLSECVRRERAGKTVCFMRLHDTLHDFAVAGATSLGELAGSHRILLSGYAATHALREHGRTVWWSGNLVHDTYIHRNLCRHLAEGGMVEQLVELLETPQWVLRQLEVSDLGGLDHDFMVGIKAVLKGSDGYGGQDETVLRLIREALTLSCGFLAKDVSNVSETLFQLHGRLVAYRDSCPRIRRYLDRLAKCTTQKWLRSVNSFLESPGSSTITMIPCGTRVNCMAVLQGTECVACGGEDGWVVVVDVKRGVVEKRWYAHDGNVAAIAGGAQGTRIVTGGMDTCAAVWNASTGQCVLRYCGHSGAVNSVAIMADGQRVASASEDGTVQVWHIETGCLATLTGPCPVRRIALFPGDEHLVSAGAEGTLRAWNISSGSQIGNGLPGYNVFMNFVAVTPDGTRILSGSCDEALRTQPAKPLEQIGDISSGEVLLELDTGVECVCLSDDGGYIVSGHANGKIRLWDAISGNPIGSTLQGHSERVCDISFQGSSDVVVSASSDGHVRVWDVGRMTELSQPPQEERISKVSFTPGGKQVVTGSMDGSLRILDTSSGQQIGQTLLGHAGAVSEVAFTPDGSRMVSVSNDKDRTVRVWDMKSQTEVAELGSHTGWISSVALTPQGNVVIAGSLNQQIYMWQLNAQDEAPFFFALEGHNEWVSHVFVSDDGKRIISAGDGCETFVWDIESRRCLRECRLRSPLQLSRSRILEFGNESSSLGASDITTCVSCDIKVLDRTILFRGKGSKVLGTMECEIKTQGFYPNKKTFWVVLRDGQIALMKLEPD